MVDWFAFFFFFVKRRVGSDHSKHTYYFPSPFILTVDMSEMTLFLLHPNQTPSNVKGLESKPRSSFANSV